jgi:RNA polymerase sigma-70 factor (ECF subfamily)
MAEGVSTDDQRRLVELAKEGDHDAWDELLGRVYPRLRAYAAQRVGAVETADDVVNETMSRAVMSIDRFQWKPGGGFDAWLFGIARRVAADEHRRLARAAREPKGPDRSMADPAPGEALELAEDHARIRASFERLSSRDREILELRVIAGLSVDHAAAVLGKRAGALRTAQSRALARLRGLLEEQQ